MRLGWMRNWDHLSRPLNWKRCDCWTHCVTRCRQADQTWTPNLSKRKKKPSKKFRDGFGHTPLSIEEKIPWKCRQLVIGTGAHGNLPVMSEVQREAERRKIKLLTLPTIEALKVLEQDPKGTNAILHVTC